MGFYFKNISTTLMLLLLNVMFSQNNKTISLAHKYIIENKLDSLNIVLKKLPNTIEYSYLKNISTKKASYQDYINLLSEYSLKEKKYFSKLNNFINTRVKQPVSLEKVNLDFVKVKWYQIFTLLNDDEIDLASIESKKLNNYISIIEKKNNTDYKKAVIYSRLFPIVTLVIQNNPKEGKKICYLSLQEAQKLNDEFLMIFSKYYLNDFLALEDNVDDFIINCDETFILEAKQKTKTIFYEPNIKHYLDAVIYKGGFDEIKVESLLNKLYSDEKTKHASYILYAKYMEYNKPNSSACKRIYNKFKVNNLSELCELFINDAKNNLNLNELNNLYDECSDACYRHKILDKAYSYKHHNQLLTQKIYSKELSQSLADYKTQEKDIENAKLKQINTEKEAKLSRQKTILIGVLIALFVFASLVYFLFKAIKQRNSSNKKLEFLNNDLNRLNVLNQKIFSVISHDFKTPLVTLTMLLSILKKKITNTTLIPYITEVDTQFENANNILNNLLNWAKAEHSLNNEVLEIKSNVNKKVTEICNQLKHLADNKSITIKKNIPEDIEVNIPADVLRIVIRNLVSNAIKFSNANSTIDISFNQSKNELIVTDSGNGMSVDKLNELFKKEVISEFGTNKEPGFGIGMYIVSELLYKYKSKITVESELNHGTRFFVSFPETK